MRWPGCSGKPRAAPPQLLRDNRESLDKVIALLLEHETIDGSDLDAIVGKTSLHKGEAQTWAPQAAAMTKGMDTKSTPADAS